MKFVHLHWHSTFSFLDAIGSPADIANKAKELEMNAIWITDYNGMYGMINFYQKAKATEIKPIIWIELGFVLDINSIIKVENIGNICLIAKNKEGYQNLIKITSFANTEWRKEIPRVDINIIKENSEWVIAFMWGTSSWLGKMILNHEWEDKIKDIIKLLQDALGKENVYGEIIAQDYTLVPEIKEINEFLMKSNIECIIDNNFQYVNKDDKATWEVALAIKDGKKMYDEDRRKPKWAYHIATEIEISKIMNKNWYSADQVNKWIETNAKIANEVNVEIDMWQALFPNYETPEDLKELYEKNRESLIEKK